MAKSITPSATRKLIGLSPTEKVLFKLVGKRKRSTLEIADRYYADVDQQPFNARQIVGGMLRSIKRKTAFNGAVVQLCSTPRQGPKPIQWWVE
jgi:hypothetical protein